MSTGSTQPRKNSIFKIIINFTLGQTAPDQAVLVCVLAFISMCLSDCVWSTDHASVLEPLSLDPCIDKGDVSSQHISRTRRLPTKKSSRGFF